MQLCFASSYCAISVTMFSKILILSSARLIVQLTPHGEFFISVQFLYSVLMYFESEHLYNSSIMEIYQL